jgi:hypothetical protein
MLRTRTINDVSKDNRRNIDMSYQIQKLDETHNAALIQLVQSINTGSECFVDDRSPNFFKLSNFLGEHSYFGLFKDSDLIGCMGISKQNRIIYGNPEEIYYLHDLRVHPKFHSTMAYYRLLHGTLKHYQGNTNVKWMFSTILDSNPHQNMITEGRDVIAKGAILGETVHLGVPMFRKRSKPNDLIKEISNQEAWQAYKNLARSTEFAPMDDKIFKMSNGRCLSIKKDQDIVALCKVVDQSDARKLRATQKLSISFKFINLLCKMKGCPPLPNRNKVFRHGYLTYYVSKGHDYRDQFLDYISQHFHREFTYVFMGLSQEEAKKRNDRMSIRLSSTTYGFGELPSQLLLDFHELTLI